MSPARFWLQRAGQGIVAGAAIASLDFLYYFPLVSATRPFGVELLASSLAVWCGECALLALALGLAERLASPGELRAWQLAAAIVVGVAASVALWHTFAIQVLRDQLGMRLFREEVTQSGNWSGGMLYHAWLMLFFGGMLAAVAASRRWRARMLEALRAAELRRAISEQRLAEARLALLEARVEPDRLHHTLSRVQYLYEHDAGAADRQLDELIAFLRTAVSESRTLSLKEVP